MQIEPASPGEVSIYSPYYVAARRQMLAQAVGLYKLKSLEGERLIEGEEAISFVASWPISPLPSDLTLCRVQFNLDAELTYELSISNFEFIDYLIDVVALTQRNLPPDFSTSFYKKLMKRSS